MEGGRGKEKGAYLEAIVTAAKLATISLPAPDAPAPRMDGRTDGRSDGQTGEHFAAAAAVHVPTRSDDDVRPSTGRVVGKEGERLRFSLPSPMMIRPSTISQIQTSHETFSSVERDVHFYYLPKLETGVISCEVRATLSFGVFLVCTLVGFANICETSTFS